MDQDKTTVMGGYGSAQAGDNADATRVVPNPGYTDPAATQPSAEPTRVMGYGDTAQPRYESHEPYREYPKSIPQYGEDEEKKPSRSSSVIKKILIVLAIFFALSVVFAIVSGMLNKRGSSTADTTAEQTEFASSSTVDLSDIPGQYWSNAKKILKSRGADLSNAVVLTDDGSTPVIDANWVVTSAYYNDNGNLEIQLTRKDGSSGNASGDQGGADSSSSNTLEDLSNKAQELGDKAQELGDTAQNLGDTAQNLGGLATDAWNALQNGISGAQGN